MVSTLLKGDCATFKVNALGHFPLQTCVHEEQDEILQLLVRHYLVHENYVLFSCRILKIESGADVNQSNADRKSALIFAIERLQSKMACRLIDAGEPTQKPTVHEFNDQTNFSLGVLSGCDVNHSDRYGCSALWHAAKQVDLQVLERLLQCRDLQFDTKDHRGASAFMGWSVLV